MKTDWMDVAKRAGWTGVQAAAAVVAVHVGEAPLWLAAPLALALSAFKSFLAQKMKPSDA